MKALIQRVTQSSVSVDGQVIGEIGVGLLVLLGVSKDDDLEQAQQLVSKVLRYRVFPDESGKMNRSVVDVAGELLVVSQFTLVADTKKGLRPSFSSGATPQKAEALYDAFVEMAKQENSERVATGSFAADMKVSLVNDGPVTFMLET